MARGSKGAKSLGHRLNQTVFASVNSPCKLVMVVVEQMNLYEECGRFRLFGNHHTK